MKSGNEVVFEESLSDEWSKDLGVIEVPLDRRPLAYLAAILMFLGLLAAGRILYLGVARADFYGRRAAANLFDERRLPAPRGQITDRYGTVLADNRPTFSALLELRDFLRAPEIEREKVLQAIQDTLNISSGEVWEMIRERNLEQSVYPVLLNNDLTQTQLVALAALENPLLAVSPNFKREYADGPVFASLLGYLGRPTAEDLARDEGLTGEDFIGKAGVEAFYDKRLRGEPGITVVLRDAKGTVLGTEKKSDPVIGKPVRLTIDAELQAYFHRRFREALVSLGRTSGVGLALDPRNGEVLAYLNFPSFDNNIFASPGRSDERKDILNSPRRPLFPRAVAGLYNPGSTIKPLVALAALAENVITPEREIFSPGYLDVPNPFDPEKPTRFVDWRYQGNVNVHAAIAQSSNVYFYEVGGGFGDIAGLGISRLNAWWEKFRLHEPTGIDLPSEESGFLPTPEWKEAKRKRPWLLGDTYNVSIGQGDLLVTPIALLNYVAAIANGGKLYQPVVNAGAGNGKVLADMGGELAAEIAEVRKGMRQTVTSPVGTGWTMHDLPIPVAGKTGSAQVSNNTQENAFFVGYAPSNDPHIALLVLVENSKEGSLNAVPIAKDVFEWYYWNRIVREKNAAKK
jgi:penicillin-binding protein 2